MTPDRHDDLDDAEHGVLSDAGAVDTGIGILGTATAQVRVVLPGASDDDLDVDDDVVVDEVAVEVDEVATGDIILEDAAADPVEPREGGAPEAEIHDADEVGAEDEPGDEPGDDGHGSAAAEPPHDIPAPDAEARAAEPPTPDAGPSLDEEPAGADGGRGEPAISDDAVAEPAALTRTPLPPEHAAVTPRRDIESGAASVAGRGPEEVAARDVDDTEASDPPAATDASATADPAASAPLQAVPVGRRISVPATRREAHGTDATRADRAHAVERVRPPHTELDLASKRLGQIDDSREGADLLTPDRLLDRTQLSGAEPEGLWQQLVYSLSGRRINLGDSRRARERKELDRRIASPLPGGARFVPVLSRKGGVGKTTVTTLLGMALAAARDDRVIAVDANPDRGTLADRLGRPGGRTVRDLARTRGEVSGYSDISLIVARDETRLDVLASDADPRVSEAFSDRDYHDVAALAAHYYSIVLTDTGTGIVHSVMGATLELADQLVVVAGLSIDEARLASETLTWLDTNGYAEQVRSAVVVLNNARPGSPLVREGELEAHFRTRVRSVIRMPYDPLIGTGSAISFRDLQPATRQAARELAAAVVEGLRSMAPAA